jgi:ParB-like chromosome segregation protein Spo0J
LLRVKRKEIKKTEAIRCVIDTANDPAEISLDENVTREDLHPADQFERFHELAENPGWGAEEIAARFGVTSHVVRQRLRLGAVSPKAPLAADKCGAGREHADNRYGPQPTSNLPPVELRQRSVPAFRSQAGPATRRPHRSRRYPP